MLEGNGRWNFTEKVSAGVSLCDKCLRGSSVSVSRAGRMGSKCMWQPQRHIFISSDVTGWKHSTPTSGFKSLSWFGRWGELVTTLLIRAVPLTKLRSMFKYKLCCCSGFFSGGSQMFFYTMAPLHEYGTSSFPNPQKAVSQLAFSYFGCLKLGYLPLCWGLKSIGVS